MCVNVRAISEEEVGVEKDSLLMLLECSENKA
jgi:hypothetical protein